MALWVMKVQWIQRGLEIACNKNNGMVVASVAAVTKKKTRAYLVFLVKVRNTSNRSKLRSRQLTDRSLDLSTELKWRVSAVALYEQHVVAMFTSGNINVVVCD